MRKKKNILSNERTEIYHQSEYVIKLSDQNIGKTCEICDKIDDSIKRIEESMHKHEIDNIRIHWLAMDTISKLRKYTKITLFTFIILCGIVWGTVIFKLLN